MVRNLEPIKISDMAKIGIYNSIDDIIWTRIITLNDLEQTEILVMHDYDKYRLSLTKQYSDISQHVMRNIIKNRKRRIILLKKELLDDNDSEKRKEIKQPVQNCKFQYLSK